MLTFPEMNLGPIEFEKLIDPLVRVDFYLPDLKLIIEVNGPSHFFEGDEKQTLPNLSGRLVPPEMKRLDINYFEWREVIGLNDSEHSTIMELDEVLETKSKILQDRI